MWYRCFVNSSKVILLGRSAPCLENSSQLIPVAELATSQEFLDEIKSHETVTALQVELPVDYTSNSFDDMHA